MNIHYNIVPAFQAIGADGSDITLQIDFASAGNLTDQYFLSQVQADGTLYDFGCAPTLTELYAQFPRFAAQVPSEDKDGLH